MAKQKEKFLVKLRFLLIGAVVFAILSNPMASLAGTQNSSEIQVESLTSTIAGLGLDFTIQGEAYSPMEVLVSKPNNKELILETVSNAQGLAYVSLYDYHLRESGTYQVSARHLDLNESYGETQSFYVFPSTVSLESKVEVSKSTAKVGETLELTVTLTDNHGNPIEGHVLKAIPNVNELEIYSPEYSTDESGEMNFYISSGSKGIAEISIFDSSSNKTLYTRPKVAFTGDGEFVEQGGFSTSYSNVILSEESGAIDSFRIEGLEEGVAIGEEVSVSVTAIDESGLTVSDYTGTIRFSSSDTGATLPNDYTFEADDQGEHTFSLSFAFLSPGEQSLSATDIDQTLISGETNFTVGDEEEVDYDSDFVTDDYEREGDFTLLSPSSGAYSNNSLEVQGEAEYGYTAVVYMNETYVGYVDVEFDNSFTYSLSNIEDGDYELYVEVGEVEIDEDDIATLSSLVETSDIETISIDTSAPELVSASLESETLASGETSIITILSESELEEVSVILDDVVTDLEESSTSGKYEALIVAPEEEGEYTIDVSLMDQLGNTVQYRDELSLTVSESEADSEASTDEDSDAESEEDETETSEEGVGIITGLTASTAEESIILSWETPESGNTIAYYRVYYGPSSDSLYAISDTFDASTSWIITNLIGDEIYYFAVSAVDIEGTEGEQSGTTLGVPTSKEDTSEEIELEKEDSNIDELNRFPNRTPDSGAGTLGLGMMSLLGSGAYMRLRKKEKV